MKKDKLKSYKILVVINLILAVLMAIMLWFVIGGVKQGLNGGDPRVGGPESFATVVLGVFVLGPAILVMIVAPMIATFYESNKLVKRQAIAPNSPWLITAKVGIGVEALTLLATVILLI